jgi:CheY-like chemotaxis protein
MPGESVLIVDDNPVNTKLASLTLRLAGYDVKTAGDAQEALEVLRSFEPALILMDIQMPGMDGLELTRQLKSDPAKRDVRIVAITSYAMKGDEDKALSAGCDGYLPKPIDTRTFADTVAGFLAAPRATA